MVSVGCILYSPEIRPLHRSASKFLHRFCSRLLCKDCTVGKKNGCVAIPTRGLARNGSLFFLCCTVHYKCNLKKVRITTYLLSWISLLGLHMQCLHPLHQYSLWNMVTLITWFSTLYRLHSKDSKAAIWKDCNSRVWESGDVLLKCTILEVDLRHTRSRLWLFCDGHVLLL